MPPPETSIEYFCVILNVLIGALYVANLVGETYTIVADRGEKSRQRQNWKATLKRYMRRHGITQKLQTKIMTWVEQSEELSANGETILGPF